MEISLLPADLLRWDRAGAGELLAVPVYTDVRPLRGAAGLLDWRLNGWLSRWLREQRFGGAPGEKLLLPTGRLPWRAVLALGAGEASALDEERCRVWLDTLFAAVAGLRFRTAAVALPGREGDRIPAARAIAVLRETMRQLAPPLDTLAIIDSPAALKVAAEALGLSGPRPVAPAATTGPAGSGTHVVQPAARSASGPTKPPRR